MAYVIKLKRSNSGMTVKHISRDVKLIHVGRQGVAGPAGADGDPGPQGPPGNDGADGLVTTVEAGTNITVDSTDPAHPIVSSTASGGGAVDSVNSQTGVVVLDADDISDSGTTNKYVTAAEKTKLSNLSGTNTGDQDLSGLVPKTTTVNGQPLSANVTVSKSDVGLSNVDNTSDATKDAAATTLTNKTITSPVITTPTGIVKGDVGLGNVDNTADTAKPVSTAQQTALDAKVSKSGDSMTGTLDIQSTTSTQNRLQLTSRFETDSSGTSEVARLHFNNPAGLTNNSAKAALAFYDDNVSTTQSKVWVQVHDYLHSYEVTSFASAAVNTSTDRITITSHGYTTTGIKGQFTTTGTLPSGLSLATYYYVKKIDNNTIEVYSNTSLSSLVDLTTQGSGTHTFTPDNTYNNNRHKHFSIEVTASDGTTKNTRFSIPYDYDTTEIGTFSSNFNINDGGKLRVNGSAGSNKEIQLGNTLSDNLAPDLTNIRWGLRQDSTSESGSNVGSDFRIVRYTNAGVAIDSPFFIKRSNGKIGLSGITSPGADLDIGAGTGTTSVRINRGSNASFSGSYVLNTSGTDQWSVQMRNDSTNDLHFRDSVNGRSPLKIVQSTGDIQIPNTANNSGSAVSTDATQTLTNKTLTSPVINTGTVGTSLVPTTDDGAPLGSTSKQFSDIFLANGAVINYNNGDLTLTKTSTRLEIAGTTGAVLRLPSTGGVELSSDTAITRASAGVIAVGGANVIVSGGALGTPSSGVATNLTGTASGLTAGNVTTNANLTGPITSSGNATSIASQTGTGTKFVVDTSPTLVTPVLGVATATSVNKVAITAPATSATITIPDGVTLTGPAASGTAMTLGNAETVTGAKTFGSAGAVGKLKVAGTTSGSTILDATAVASGTLTLPAATDTLVGKATTDTFTNKTYDTAGTGNSFSINGVAATANTGTGAVVRAAAPALTGVATADQLSYNNNAVSVSSNAGTVPVTFRHNTFTNSSAANMTITMATASAADGQMTVVRIYDASAVAKTITWVNTENSSVTAPTTSNGSTTLPLTVGFQYNSATSKWRCIASA